MGYAGYKWTADQIGTMKRTLKLCMPLEDPMTDENPVDINWWIDEKIFMIDRQDLPYPNTTTPPPTYYRQYIKKQHEIFIINRSNKISRLIWWALHLWTNTYISKYNARARLNNGEEVRGRHHCPPEDGHRHQYKHPIRNSKIIFK